VEIVDVPNRMGRCQLILGTDGITLVDTGADPGAKAILAAIAERGLRPADLRRIVLTHGDGDHVGGARRLQELSGAEVVAHELEVDYIGGRVPRRFPIAKRALGILAGRRPRPSISRVMTGETLLLGEIELVHAPGHTPGHIIVRAGAALIVGDAFRTGDVFAEVPAPMTVDRRLARDTIRRIAEMPVTSVYSGHGPPAMDAARRLATLASRLASLPR
jgi:glyoxylase-like metal-dependent hydrolase (beta-lactamase superfamily II)